MLTYILRRIFYSLPLLLLITFISFVVITLPPGDYMTTLQNQLTQRGGMTQNEAREVAQKMRERYGLDKPFFIQYTNWLFGIIRGDFGYSFSYRKPVFEIIWGKLGWTFLIALSSYLFAVIGGIIPGIYSATKQYSFGDNIFTILAFVGLSIPNFFLALILMYVLVFWFGADQVGGFFSPQYVMRPWDWAKIVDFLKHFWLPVVVVGTSGTARNMRVMRGNLLDILGQPYIQTARAKGLKERVVIYKHALRNAIQPIIMFFGMTLPSLITGAVVTSIVLNLPTTGAMFYNSLTTQDMYLAGTFLLLIAIALVLGNILADVLLAWVDPRIRYD